MRNHLKVCLMLVVWLLLFWSEAGAQAPTNPNKSDKPTGAITGRVVNLAGEPVPGASVSANAVGGAPRSKNVTVNGSGDFRIEGLEPGVYRLFAGMTGYVSTLQSESPIYCRIGDSVTLTLMKGAVITGAVTGPNGPIVGVGVFATRVKDQDGKKLTSSFGSRERQTDDRGMFRIYSLLPGTYILWAAKPRLGMIAPSSFDYDAPIYHPSATRDTASEIVVQSGDEVTADIQYRSEQGHAVSGKVIGVVQTDRFGSSATIGLTDMRTRSAAGSAGTFSAENFSFAIYGVPDGEYELSATQFLPTRDQLSAVPRRITVRGADVTGIDLTLGLQASIDGRLAFENDTKAACGRRKETAAPETMVYARRFERERKDNSDAKTDLSEAPISLANFSTFAVGDPKGSFALKNLPPGSYQIDPIAPASGWYLRSIAVATAPSTASARSIPSTSDVISVRRGERVTGLLVIFTEGAARLRGHVSTVEGKTPPPRMAIYLIPAEREAAGNVLRFYEANLEADRTFSINHINPGKYLILARPSEETESGTIKSIRRDSSLRTTIFQEATALKNEISLKPCEQVANFDLPLTSPR